MYQILKSSSNTVVGLQKKLGAKRKKKLNSLPSVRFLALGKVIKKNFAEYLTADTQQRVTVGAHRL
jgi:hypothetical protein